MLYNTYRPKKFSEVEGQEETLLTLKKQVETRQFASSYLLTGHRGTGKTTIERILARSICCEHPTKDGPCNNCASCKAIINNSTYDYLELDAASNNSVNDIKELVASTAYPPTTLEKKIYAIDEVHNLSSSAFDALLKTIEEPPSYCVFILCTTELHKIPATIKSRCSIYQFNALSIASIYNRLIYVLKDLGKEYEEDAVSLIAKQADGALRDALSILEKLTVQAEKLTVNLVRKSLCLMDDEVTLQLLHYLVDCNAPDGLVMLQVLYEEGRSLSLMVDNLIQSLVDTIVIKSSGGAAKLYNSKSYITEITKIAGKIAMGQLFVITDQISGLKEKIRNSLNPYIDVQMGFIRCCTDLSADRHQELYTRLEILELEVLNLKSGISISGTQKCNTEDNVMIKNVDNGVEQPSAVDADGFVLVTEDTALPLSEDISIKQTQIPIVEEEGEITDEEEDTSSKFDILELMGNCL